MDGVLLDSGEQHLKSWKMLLAEHGKEMPDSLFWETFGQTNFVTVPHIFRRVMSREEIVQFADRKEELYRNLIQGKVEPLPGLMEFMRGLSERGWSVAVGSSGPHLNVELVIKEIGLSDYVSAFTCSEDVAHGKPDPEVFLKAAGKIDIEPSSCVVVEDSLHGVEAAHRAGMKCIAITTTEDRAALSHADMVIDSYLEISPSGLEELLMVRNICTSLEIENRIKEG